MHITLNIPEDFAASIERLAALDGITPTQWVTRTIKRAVRPAQGAGLGRPRINDERDAEIRAKRAAGQQPASLAKEYGISLVRVQQITARGV